MSFKNMVEYTQNRKAERKKKDIEILTKRKRLIDQNRS